MHTLADIEKLTKEFSEGRDDLATRVRALEEEIQGVKKRYLVGIKKSVARVAEKQHALKAALEDSKGLFQKPKTIILHGIKIGFQKAKGKISWADDSQVVKLIKKHFPESAELLIKTTEKPLKDALQGLAAADLKRIGVTVEETGDIVVIKSTDSEIDKFVDALLKDEDPGKEEAA
jgi:hypothetical protein